MTVDIRPVRSRSEREAFIRFPFRLYADDPDWVPPLLSQQRRFLDPAHNPFFEFAEVALWLAVRAGEVVGTISSHIDHRHNEVHNRRDGMFGFFECIADYAVAEALLTTARDWARQRGMTHLRGPLSFSQNHTCGLLIAGDPGPPVFMLAHNPAYYPSFLERFGLRKALDLFAYRLDMTQFAEQPERLLRPLARLTGRLRRNPDVVLRSGHTSDRRTFYADMEKIRTVFNAAWAGNAGFVPVSAAEFRQLAADLRPALDMELVLGAEVGGVPAAFAIALPDLNQVLIHLGGRLFPVGWLKWLWYRRRVTRARLLLMGVDPAYRGYGLDAWLVASLAQVALRRGYEWVDLSWVAEDNHAVQGIIRHVCGPHGVRPYRTYRLYQMALDVP